MFERLGNKVMIKKAEETVDVVGNISENWVNFKQKFVNIQQLDVNEMQILPRINKTLSTHKAKSRNDSEVTEGMTVAYFDKNFQITYIVYAKEKEKYMTLYLKQIV